MVTTALNTTEEKHVTGHRTSKLTPQMIDKLAKIVREGHYIVTACQAAGIHKTTFYDWLTKGDKEIERGVTSLNTHLIYAIKKAEAQAEQDLLSVIKDKAINGKEWLPAMTILERRHPERWGRKDRSTLVVEETKQIIITTVEVVKDYGRGQMIEGEAKEIEDKK